MWSFGAAFVMGNDWRAPGGAVTARRFALTTP